MTASQRELTPCEPRTSAADDDVELSRAPTERGTDDEGSELNALDITVEIEGGKLGTSLFSMLDSDTLSHIASLLSSADMFAMAEVCKECMGLFKPPALALSSVSLRHVQLSQALQARSASSSQVFF